MNGLRWELEPIRLQNGGQRRLRADDYLGLSRKRFHQPLFGHFGQVPVTKIMQRAMIHETHKYPFALRNHSMTRQYIRIRFEVCGM